MKKIFGEFDLDVSNSPTTLTFRIANCCKLKAVAAWMRLQCFIRATLEKAVSGK
jgi:hypothetical protein